MVDAGATGVVASATASFSGGRSAEGGSMVGAETLYSFSGEEASQAMSRIRRLVTECAKIVTPTTPPAIGAFSSTHRFTAVSGPRLGDDSIRIRATTTYGNHPKEVRHDDALVVRASNSLVILRCVPTTQKLVSQARILTRLGFDQGLDPGFPRPTDLEASAGAVGREQSRHPYEAGDRACSRQTCAAGCPEECSAEWPRSVTGMRPRPLVRLRRRALRLAALETRTARPRQREGWAGSSCGAASRPAALGRSAVVVGRSVRRGAPA